MAFDVVSILNLFYFKRTLVVVIGSKLFPFSGGETDCSDSFSFGLNLELKILVKVYSGDTLWLYPANVSECDRFSAITVERKKWGV